MLLLDFREAHVHDSIDSEQNAQTAAYSKQTATSDNSYLTCVKSWNSADEVIFTQNLRARWMAFWIRFVSDNYL